uniref:Mitochondrial import receptor subunit TOM34 n=1 Tax=Monodelphis domestica TaxID=13616 RepID=F7FY89_MONDO
MAPKPPGSVLELRVAGNESFRSGQYAEAAELYGRALDALRETGPANPEEESVLYSNRAACHLKDGNCTHCIKDCSVALSLVPFGIKPLLRRAAAYEALEKYQLAYVDYKTVLQIDCTLPAAHDGVNRMTKALMDTDGLEWRLKLPPIPSVPIAAQKRWEAAPGGDHEKAAKTKLKETDTLNNKVPTVGDIKQARALKEEGNELVKKGKHKEAVEKYSESLTFSSLESATYTNRALCYLSLKKYKEAVKDCTEALKLDSKNIKAFYRRAQAFKELEDYQSSLEDVNSLLSIEPENSAATKLRQEVNRNLKI